MPLALSTSPFDSGCLTDAKWIFVPIWSQKSLKASESNCVPLSTVIAFGTPKRQTIFCQKNFWTVAEVIVAKGFASIHLEKYSTATTTYLRFPWADGNGRTCRLLMNLLQMEYDVLPTKVLKEDKAEYIQALIDTRENEDISIFIDCMTRLHCQHLKADIDQYIESTSEKMVDKTALQKGMVDKWSIKPSLAEKLVDILEFVADKDEFTTEQIVNHLGFNATTAKRYLRQLTEFGYLEPHGGNKNRTYSKKE